MGVHSPGSFDEVGTSVPGHAPDSPRSVNKADSVVTEMGKDTGKERENVGST